MFISIVAKTSSKTAKLTPMVRLGNRTYQLSSVVRNRTYPRMSHDSVRLGNRTYQGMRKSLKACDERDAMRVADISVWYESVIELEIDIC